MFHLFVFFCFCVFEHWTDEEFSYKNLPTPSIHIFTLQITFAKPLSYGEVNKATLGYQAPLCTNTGRKTNAIYIHSYIHAISVHEHTIYTHTHTHTVTLACPPNHRSGIIWEQQWCKKAHCVQWCLATSDILVDNKTCIQIAS